ncbi:hypothetical protein OXX69_005731 [Metschnikowia pulcherrima]
MESRDSRRGSGPSIYLKFTSTLSYFKGMRRFYTTACAPFKFVPPIELPIAVVRPNPLINNMPRVKRDPVACRPPVSWQDLPHIRKDILPEKATDIRGIDSAGHQFFSRRPLFGKIPMLLSSKYFTVTFLPHTHTICSLRKSNIAYTFTNYGGPNLNDQSLQKNLTEYKGKYRALEYFKSVHSPMGTAVSRSKFRKLVKRALHRALHEVVPNTPGEVEIVSGIFHFRFNRYPTSSERIALKKDVKSAVTKLYTNSKLRERLFGLARQQSRAYPNLRMLARDFKTENIAGARTTRGYFPKLPYLANNGHAHNNTK